MSAFLLVAMVVWATDEVAFSILPADLTWQNTTSVTFSGNCSGSDAGTNYYTGKIWVNDSSVGSFSVFYTNTSVINDTLFTYSTTLSANTKFTWYVDCNSSANSTVRTLWIDTATPTICSFGGNTPDDNAYVSSAILNATATDALSNGINISFTVNDMINNATATVTSGAYGSISQEYSDGLWNYTATCTDNVSYYKTSTQRFFTYDNTAPVVVLNESTEVNGDLDIRFSFIETNFDSCGLRVYNISNDVVTDTVTAARDGTNYNCSVTLTGSDITNTGFFYYEPYVIDKAGTTGYAANVTNNTYIELYAGWNLIRNDRAQYLTDLTALDTDVFTHASLWDNQNKNYTTYAIAANTNNETQLYDNNAVWVYSNASSQFLRKDSAGNLTDSLDNDMFYSGWNQIAIYNITPFTMAQMNNSAIWVNAKNTTDNSWTNVTAVAQYFAYLNPADNKYDTWRVGFTLGANQLVSYGYGLWFKIDGTAQGAAGPTNYTYVVNITQDRGR